MRIGSAAEPIGVQRRSKHDAEFGWDTSDEAATLVYDLPEREAGDRPLSTEPPPRAHAKPRLSDLQLTVTVSAALIGAMAGAWAIDAQARGVAPPVDALVTAVDELWRVDLGAIVAAVTPRASAPARSARAAIPGPSPRPSAAPAPEPEPVAKSEPTGTMAAIAAPAARAVPSETEPEKAAPTLAPDRRKHRTAARARSSRGARSRPAVARSEPAPEATPRAAQPAASRMGLLRINSRPWSQVYVDGRPVGSTPQTAIELRPGRHRIVLVSKEFELKRTLTVVVRAGQTVTRSVELLQ